MQYLPRRGSRRESTQQTDNMSGWGLGKPTERSPIRRREEADDMDDRNYQKNTSFDHSGLLALQQKRMVTSRSDEDSVTTTEGQLTVSGRMKRSQLDPQGYSADKKSSGSTSALVEGSSSYLKSSQPETMRPGLAEFRQDLLNHQPNAQLEAPCQFHFQNVFSDFFSNELDMGDRLWDLVILSGDPSAIVDDAGLSGGVSALTCGEYVEMTWPQSSTKIAEMFHTIETKWSATGVTHQLSSNSSTFGSLHFSGTNSFTDTVSVLLKGSPTGQADLGEAFLWLCTVIRDVGDSDSPVASTLHLDKAIEGQASYRVRYDPTTQLRIPKSSSCWAVLFPRTPCAIDATMQARPHHMQGLQLTFELMLLLCGLDYEIIDLVGVILLGQKSMVYPLRMNNNCVQWHFQQCDPDNPSSYQIAGPRLQCHDLELLRHKQHHFLGQWSNPLITLGTDSIEYQPIGFSEAEEIAEETTADGYTVGGSISAPKILSFSYTRSYKFARSRKNQYITNFSSKLHAKIGLPVLLYSPSEKRGWIVSYVSLLLHLARARAKFQNGMLGFQVPACELSSNGGLAAAECIIAHRCDPLRKAARNEILTEQEKEPTIEEYVKDVEASMEEARRQTCRAKHLLSKAQARIIGYDLADISHMKDEMMMKQYKLDLFAKGWAALLDEVRYTFFCEDLPDPIVPDKARNLERGCWLSVPKGFNLLTVSLPCLCDLAERRNGRTGNLDRLTDKLWWHCRLKPFLKCGSKPHDCFLLQELAKEDLAQSPGVAIADAKQRGAVIFRSATSRSIILGEIERNPKKFSYLYGNDQPHGSHAPHSLGGLEVPSANHGHLRPDSGYDSALNDGNDNTERGKSRRSFESRSSSHRRHGDQRIRDPKNADKHLTLHPDRSRDSMVSRKSSHRSRKSSENQRPPEAPRPLDRSKRSNTLQVGLSLFGRRKKD
ncbi:hypothetical protein GJ744_001860 [Endocarpon pusillum]|uniref:Uncharacterized protein n=1 Tax=Endocarpon pusillum TaxID=364733 RepID=A0A8H7E7M9_9EURO|nr:hypothetical protein GJ744_001860 [Endocarpon pusillum]